MPGLFADSNRGPVRGFASSLPRCGECGLYKKCQSPKMPADGDGRKGILIVGEGPGADEDKKGRPFCLDENTLVLTLDLKWKPISKVEVGDSLLSFDEDASPTGGASQRKWRVSVVTRKVIQQKECLQVDTEFGTLIGTRDHRVLTSYQTSCQKKRWLEIGRLQKAETRASSLAFLFTPWKTPRTYREGWAAGFLDGEGCLTINRRGPGNRNVFSLFYAQNEGPIDDRAVRVFTKLGFTFAGDAKSEYNGVTCMRRRLTGGFREVVRFLGSIRPRRLLAKFVAESDNLSNFRTIPSRVLSIRPAGVRTVVDITTTTGTFIANGFAVHNCGKSGRFLRDTLLKFGIDMRRDCVLTNAVICRPPGNATPDAAKVDACRPNLLKVIKEHDPKAVLIVGGSGVRAVVGHLWREDPGRIGRWAGFAIPNHNPNAWVCPTYHPAFVGYTENDPIGPMAKARFEAHVGQAVRLAKKGRPWPAGPPDFRKQIHLIHSPKEAARELRRWTAKGAASAFDFETDRLKPDDADAEIVSCAVCFGGEHTIAFPVLGRVRDALREYLRSPAPKIGYNIKFEERWAKAKLGVRVRGFGYARGGWDGMMGAHVIDHRPDITSAKFQAFVLLGQADYAARVAPYLKADGPRLKNRIHELNPDDLLLYNGMDAVVEWFIAVKQVTALRIDRSWL